MKMFKRNSQCAFLVKFFLKDFGNELNCECFVFCALCFDFRQNYIVLEAGSSAFSFF